MMTWRPAQRGFSLVELVLVIVITGVLAGVLTVFVRPAIDSYSAQRGRSEMQAAAHAALQAMARDVRLALPNSIRTPGDQCFELIPTRGGGRYRMAGAPSQSPDLSAVLDTSTVTSAFDVLGDLNGAAAVGDWVVVGNQSSNEAYQGSNRSAITAIAAPPSAVYGQQRFSVNAIQFPVGYGGGRFFVVPASEPAVFYRCSGAGVSNGEGTGTLTRNTGYGFNAAYPTACPTTVGAVIATRVAACSFVFDQRSLSEFGVMSLRLELMRNGERASLQYSAMTSNVP
jgi:MSHA biogenesis protein MshO